MTVPPVYDASALLAVIFDEPGADAVMEYLATPGGAVSTVNWSEVVAKLAERGVAEADISSELSPFGLDIIPFDEAQATVAGGLRPITRELGLSLGDRCCLALARVQGAASSRQTERGWNWRVLIFSRFVFDGFYRRWRELCEIQASVDGM